MEAKICCAYNVSRGCRISSKVILADCAGSPFKLMKLMLDGLAKDPDAGFWLTGISQTPQIVRLFPFDFVYLDSDQKIIQTVELPPEAKLPRFHPGATSAIILPLNSLSLSGTGEGDALLICAEEEFEGRLAEIASSPRMLEPVVVPVPDDSVRSKPTKPSPSSPPRGPAQKPVSSPPLSIPIPSSSPSQGAGHTFALSSRWLISNSTPAGVLLDTVELDEVEAIQAGVAESVTSLAELVDANTAEAVNDEVVEEGSQDAKEQADSASGKGAETKALEESPATAASPAASPERQEMTASQSAVPLEEKEEDTQADAMDENVAILDTDLASIFDAALAEEFGAGNGLEAPRTGTARTSGTESATEPGTDDRIAAPIPAVESAPNAKKEPPQATPAPVVAPKATAPLQKTQAPARVVQTKPAAPKTEREDLRQKVPLGAPALDSQGPKPRSSNRGRKKTLGNLVKEFLNCPDPPPELRSSPRLVQHGMIAYEKQGDGLSPMEARDVSPAGVFLRTKKRWQLQKVFTLTLQSKGASENDFQSRVNVKVEAVRNDEEGVGLAWVFPRSARFEPWRRLHAKKSDESDIQFFIRELRLAKAMGFLQEICPTAEEEIRHALHERFSNKRVASAVQIALEAEDLADGSVNTGPMLAHSDIVVRVLENGSWIEEDWIRRMWAGLLVSSCTSDGEDKSNLPFIDLMARFTPIHLRILSFVCRRAADAIAAGKPEAKLDVYSTTKELMEAADSHSFQRIQQTIGHLCGFGLLQEASRPSYTAGDDKVKTRTTPTVMGLRMYAHCMGRRS